MFYVGPDMFGTIGRILNTRYEVRISYNRCIPYTHYGLLTKDGTHDILQHPTFWWPSKNPLTLNFKLLF